MRGEFTIHAEPRGGSTFFDSDLAPVVRRRAKIQDQAFEFRSDRWIPVRHLGVVTGDKSLDAASQLDTGSIALDHFLQVIEDREASLEADTGAPGP